MTELTVETVHEMRGTGGIATDSALKPRYVSVETHNGTMTLKEGAYRVTFNETIEVEEGKRGVIRSSVDLTSVGAFLLPRRVGAGTHDEVQSTLMCLRTVELEPDAPMATVSIEEYLDMASVEEYVDEKVGSMAEYLKYGSVEDTP